jgi:ABC-type lipoprotein export system ATPase subunit
MDIHVCEHLKGNSEQANSSVLIILHEEHVAKKLQSFIDLKLRSELERIYEKYGHPSGY